MEIFVGFIGFYIIAAFHRNYVGVLVNRLVAEYSVSVQNIIFIGHSLGAHIAGFSSKKFTEITGKKLPRIIALDPAGPLFLLRSSLERLNENGAAVVMAIHTDAGFLCYPTRIGTIDFFPNGGANQPGCSKTLKLIDLSTYNEHAICSHIRCLEFLVEAFNSTDSFPAIKCKNYKFFEANKCDDEVVHMGDLTTHATGAFYLRTNSKKPFNRSLE